MGSSIRPLSEVAEPLVTRYLSTRGLPPELARWKFFDPCFNPRRRERGLVWIRDDRVQGFLGMIPAALGRGDSTTDLDWTCDWSLEDPLGSPGMGIMLLKRAMSTTNQLMYLTRGSEYTASLSPRIAQRTVEDAVAMFVIPLRAGALLTAASRRLPALRLDRWPWITGLPLRRLPRAEHPVSVEPRIPRQLAAVFERPRGDGWFPRYDWTYLDWVIARCPVLESATAWVPAPEDAAGPRALCVFWRRKESPRAWRAAVWADDRDAGLVASLVAEVVRQVSSRGGWQLSLLASRRDESLLEVIGSFAGALRRPAQPLFIFTSKHPVIEEVERLSFVDADLAYQF